MPLESLFSPEPAPHGAPCPGDRPYPEQAACQQQAPHQPPISYDLPPVYEDEAGYAGQSGYAGQAPHGGQPGYTDWPPSYDGRSPGSGQPSYGGDATLALLPAHAEPPSRPEPDYRGAPDDGREPHVSVVLPCSNQQAQVGAELDQICRAMDASGLAYELVVVDDASTDGTQARLRLAQSRLPRLRVTTLPRHGGPGTVRRIGTEQARGDIVVWTAVGAGYPNGRIPEFVAMLDADPMLGQVVGARTAGAGGAGGGPARWMARKLAERVTNSAIPDLDSGFRAFRRETAGPYLRVLAPGSSYGATLTLAFGASQQDVRHVPIGRTGRAAALRPFPGGCRYLLQVLRAAMYFKPLKVLLPPGLLLVCLGICLGIYDLAAHPSALGSALLIFLSGLIIASLALLADLYVRSRGDT